MPEDKIVPNSSSNISSEEIDACISTLEKLLSHTNQLYKLVFKKISLDLCII